jgi:hypothetical protein
MASCKQRVYVCGPVLCVYLRYRSIDTEMKTHRDGRWWSQGLKNKTTPFFLSSLSVDFQTFPLVGASQLAVRNHSRLRGKFHLTTAAAECISGSAWTGNRSNSQVSQCFQRMAGQ